MIDLQYANADEKRAIENRTKLQGRLDNLLKELNPENEVEPSDELTTTNEEPQQITDSSNVCNIEEIIEDSVIDSEEVQSEKPIKKNEPNRRHKRSYLKERYLRS